MLVSDDFHVHVPLSLEDAVFGLLQLVFVGRVASLDWLHSHLPHLHQSFREVVELDLHLSQLGVLARKVGLGLLLALPQLQALLQRLLLTLSHLVYQLRLLFRLSLFASEVFLELAAMKLPVLAIGSVLL